MRDLAIGENIVTGGVTVIRTAFETFKLSSDAGGCIIHDRSGKTCPKSEMEYQLEKLKRQLKDGDLGA